MVISIYKLVICIYKGMLNEMSYRLKRDIYFCAKSHNISVIVAFCMPLQLPVIFML